MRITTHAMQAIAHRMIPVNPRGVIAKIKDPRHNDSRELWLTNEAIVYVIDHNRLITAYWEIPRRLLLLYDDCKAEKEILEETWNNARRNQREGRNWW